MFFIYIIDHVLFNRIDSSEIEITNGLNSSFLENYSFSGFYFLMDKVYSLFMKEQNPDKG